MKRSPVRRTVIACGLLLALGACGDVPGSGEGSTSGVPTPSSPSATPDASATLWIAVVDVAPEPSQLDALTRRLRGPLGTALVVSPTDCFEGLPDRAGEGYLIGAAGATRSEVERLVVDAGEKVVFTAEVRNVCTD
jgi:hypothetical protein